jgi:protein angel
MSYNVLAQNLLESNPYLYTESAREDLTWDYRWQGIKREVLTHHPDIVCLQEVQFRKPNHFLSCFGPFFSSLGYKYVLKARTGNKDDGCAIFYLGDKFTVDEFSALEYKVDRVSYLDRDNVGIICRLSSNSYPSKQVVIANTHLLYNPRRVDVRLCQSAMFLAEVDRFAMTYSGEYLPTIVTGDFNSNPSSPTYQLMSQGSYTYEGLPIGRSSRRLPRKMLPDNLGLSDSCQWQVKLEQRGRADLFTTGSGSFNHNFWFNSVYPPNEWGVTTFQDSWVMVDYMLYSGGLDLVGRQELPTSRDLNMRIPSDICPSDHFPLLADFVLS